MDRGELAAGSKAFDSISYAAVVVLVLRWSVVFELTLLRRCPCSRGQLDATNAEKEPFTCYTIHTPPRTPSASWAHL